MEIATMPYVAEAAPPVAPKVQGRESGGGQGKSADSFAGLMAGVLGDGAGEAASSTEQTARTADQADQTDQAAASNGIPVFAFQIPANMLPLLTAQTMQAPQTDGAATTAANAQTASVGGVQAAGAGQTGFAALMAAAGQTQSQQPQASQNAGEQPGLPAAPNQAIAAMMQQMTDGQAVSAKTVATPTPTTASAQQVPIVLAPAGTAAAVQPQQQPTTGQEASQPSATAEQPKAAPAESPVLMQSSNQEPLQASGGQVPAAAAQVQVASVAKEAANQAAKPAIQADQPAAEDKGQQAANATGSTSPAPTQKGSTAPARSADERSDGKATTEGGSQEKTAAVTTDQTPPAPVFAHTLDRQQGPSQTTAASTDAVPTQSASDPYNIAGQIVDQAKLITKQDSSEMVIRLKPEHLGEVTMKVTVEAGAVSATFHAANPEVRGAIEATLTQLRQDMTDQGLKVDYVGIYASLDQFFRGDQHQTPQQQIKLATRRSRDEEAVTEAVTAVSAQNQPSGSGGIDYRI